MEANIVFSGTNQKLFSRVVLSQNDLRKNLIVPETHNAILIKDGQMLQTLSSGKYAISKLVEIEEDETNSLEILYMSKTAKLKLLWGTPSKLLMFDSVLQENYKLGLSGDFEVQISDPRKCYLYLVGVAEDLTADSLQDRLMSTVVSVIETVLVEYLEKNNISYNKLSLSKKVIASEALKKLSHKLNSEYGIAVFSFNIANIIIDDQDMTRLSSVAKQDKTTEVDKTLFCSGCGAKLKSDAKFCSECGKRVGGGKVCPQCSAENSDDAKFCSECGNSLK